MQKNLMSTFLIGIAGALLSHAENKGSLVFSGSSDTDCILDLDKYNRIIIGEESMTITHSDHPDNPVELLYSAFDRIEINDTDVSEVSEIPLPHEGSLVYDKARQVIRIDGDESSIYTVGIFSLDGQLISHSTVYGNETISTESLLPATYVAVAVSENNVKNIKFIK